MANCEANVTHAAALPDNRAKLPVRETGFVGLIVVQQRRH